VALTERFSVSRTPVRQALLQLQSLGLVRFQSRQGAIVTSMSPRRVVGMWEVLTQLEGLAAKLAARRMPPEECDALLAHHLSSQEAAESGDFRAYDASNRALHEAIYHGARNEYLDEDVRDLRQRLRVYRPFPFRQKAQLETSFAEHAEIVRAIRDGEAEAADRAMQDHISRGGRIFADLIAEHPFATSE